MENSNSSIGSNKLVKTYKRLQMFRQNGGSIRLSMRKKVTLNIVLLHILKHNGTLEIVRYYILPILRIGISYDVYISLNCQTSQNYCSQPFSLKCQI